MFIDQLMRPVCFATVTRMNDWLDAPDVGLAELRDHRLNRTGREAAWNFGGYER